MAIKRPDVGCGTAGRAAYLVAMALTRTQAAKLCAAFRLWTRHKVRGRKPDVADVLQFNVFVTFASDYREKCAHAEVVELFRRRRLIA